MEPAVVEPGLGRAKSRYDYAGKRWAITVRQVDRYDVKPVLAADIGGKKTNQGATFVRTHELLHFLTGIDADGCRLPHATGKVAELPA